MRGKLIVIEGTDCSGKQTQAELLLKRFHENLVLCQMISFPVYSSPTGKIIGGPYLGKEQIGEGWFKEGAPCVDPLVSSFYYVADRRYHVPKINRLLEHDCNVILDRYSYSNMAHQGGKERDPEKRKKLYEKLELLEFGIAELPQADYRIFLHMPYEAALTLKKDRIEKPDQLESDPDHLKNAEEAYLEIAQRFNFKTIECVENGRIKTIEEVHEEIYDYLSKEMSLPSKVKTYE